MSSNGHPNHVANKTTAMKTFNPKVLKILAIKLSSLFKTRVILEVAKGVKRQSESAKYFSAVLKHISTDVILFYISNTPIIVIQKQCCRDEAKAVQ